MSLPPYVPGRARTIGWPRRVGGGAGRGRPRTRGVEDAVAVHKTLIVDADEGLRVRDHGAVHPDHGLALRGGIGGAGGGGRGRVDDGVSQVVEAAGGSIADITRLTWYVTDKAEYVANQSKVGAVYRDVMGYHFPAMTMVVVSALVEDEAKVEIEATAVLS